MNKKRVQIFFAFLVIIIIVVWAGYFTKSSGDTSTQTKVYFLNVGQGDSEYIKTKSGKDVLIDGGPNDKVLGELGKVMDFNDRKIDLVVLTHPHADHLTGLIEVLNRYEVGEIWESGVSHPNPTYDTWKKEIQEKNIPDKFVRAGDEINFEEVNFKVLYPLTSFENKKLDNINNASVVTKLKDGRTVFLFLGDLEKTGQSSILNNLPLVTVLKVAHHASENGTSEDLLKVTRPAVAVIEVGEKNIYGHPHQSTLNLLKKYLVQIYRTDQNGTVTISTDGQNYQIKTEK